MQIRYTKEKLYEMDAVDVYKLVLRGDVVKKFPMGFWQQPEARSNAIKCTRYLIEEILKYDTDTLLLKNSKVIYANNKLGGMLKGCFRNSPYNAINAAYPGKFQEWEFSCAPKGFWNDRQNGINATRWLIETKLKLSDEQIKDQLSQKLFEENNISGMLDCCFDGSPYKAINAVYPGKFQEWELKYVPIGFWNDRQNGINATRWLIETELKLSDEQLREQLSVELFSNNGLRSMLQNCFDDSPYKAINAVYPGRFQEWEFKNVPMGFWKDKQNRIGAIRWLIETKLKLSDEQLKDQLSYEFIVNNGLGGMLQYFDNSPYKVINTAYPGKFQEWEFQKIRANYWDDIENGIEATRWLIETKLKLSDEGIKEQLSNQLFKDNGLGGMLHICFNDSSYGAINAAYPNKFKKSDFKGYKKCMVIEARKK